MPPSATNWLIRYPAGTALAAWRAARRALPLHFVDADVSAVELPAVPGGAPQDLLGVDDGVGPLYHRRYRIRLRCSRFEPDQLMQRIVGDLGSLAPREVAAFDKRSGAATGLEVGDEYVVRLPGPWDGPVRVLERTPTRFLLGTRRGHPEAGLIRFRTGLLGEDLGFEIESWARSSGRGADLLYDRLGLSRAVQTHVWATFCERVATLSGGRPVGGVLVYTGRTIS
ncbi:MAG: hypothetical protein OJJ54_11195 [Pseudonocardia sp.]|nr:hypothetical protein [Pseudonocardia sp.]